MPFDPADPRSGLRSERSSPSTTVTFAEPQLIPFTEVTAERSKLGSHSWWVRTQHAVVGYMDAAVGERMERPPEGDETLVILPDSGTTIAVEFGGRTTTIVGRSITVVPAGVSCIETQRPGVIVRVLTASASDLIERCANRDQYRLPAPNVPHYKTSVGPSTLSSYALSDHPPELGRFGSIFRSQNLMVNVIDTRVGPREVRKLSPHTHPDFEQCSVQLEGAFTHHARTPWTPDMTAWRDDVHWDLNGPGAVIFPPPLVHTSQATGAGSNRLLDVFAPPRTDFLDQPGWVLNRHAFT